MVQGTDPWVEKQRARAGSLRWAEGLLHQKAGDDDDNDDDDDENNSY